MVVLVGVLRHAGAKLDGPLDQLSTAAQAQLAGGLAQDALVSHSLWQLQVGDLCVREIKRERI